MTHEQENLQEIEWQQHIERCIKDNKCPFSGLPGPECKSWLCDCFQFEDKWRVSQK